MRGTVKWIFKKCNVYTTSFINHYCICVSVLKFIKIHLTKIVYIWGARVAQSVKRLISAQVMILWFVDSSPTSGSVLTAQSLEPASDL